MALESKKHLIVKHELQDKHNRVYLDINVGDNVKTCTPKKIYPNRSIGTPHPHQLRRLFPVCKTALSAVYCSSYLSVCLTKKNPQCYIDREKPSQLMATGVAMLL